MRKLSGSWINEFTAYLSDKGSPAIYTRWAGIFGIAAALERKVWIRSKKGKLFPNMYIVTVGPPGAGKTLATSVVHDMLCTLEEHHIAPTSVTKASLIDALSQSERRIIRPGEDPSIVSFNSLIITSDELGVFLPAYENDFMNVLTNLYDCRIYSETRRTNKISIKMENPQLNFSAATTPSYLNALLPEGAWDQGFLSRTMLIYSGAEAPSDIFGDVFEDNETEQKLIADLQEISEYYGKMEFTEEAIDVVNAWHKSGGAPAPDHPKLQHYNTRRTAHLLKLCMVASASDNDSLVIDLDHVAEAMDWLAEAEGVMADIFKSMKNGGDGRVIEEAYHFLYSIWVKKKEPVAEHRLFNFLQERTPAHNVERIAQVMEKAGLVKKQFAEFGMGYIPQIRKVG
jgi:hypothetical protein